MESIREIQKKYCTRAITAAIFIGLFFIVAGQKPIGKGLILGTIFSIINFIIMGETLPHRIGNYPACLSVIDPELPYRTILVRKGKPVGRAGMRARILVPTS